jgi:hypothetical protein
MKILNKKILSFGAIILFLLVLNLPMLVTFGAGYQLLERSVIIDAPQGAQPETYGLKEYLKTAYLVLFVLVITAIVFWFIIGGLEYITSDLPGIKIDGKSKINKALLGLAIALSSYLLLQLINPDLLKFKLELTP